MAIYCPTCQRNDQVKKVTAIVAEGTWSANTYSGNPYTGWYNTTNSSQLVKNLLYDEPKQKVIGCAPGVAQIFLGVIGFFCFVVAGNGAFSDPNSPSQALGGLIGVVICGGFSILLLVISAVRRIRYRRQWTNDHALWQQDFNRQYYCSLDGTVFYV